MTVLQACLCPPTAVFHVSPPRLIQSTQNAFQQTSLSHIRAKETARG